MKRIFLNTLGNSIDIIEFEKLIEDLRKLTSNSIKDVYSEEEFEELEDEIDTLESEIEDFETSIDEIKGYIESILNVTSRYVYLDNIFSVIEEEKISLLQNLENFKMELKHRKQLLEEQGEKNIRIFYYFCKKFFRGDVRTHIFLYPTGYWFENETIESILNKDDDFEHYRNIICMEERILTEIDNSNAPEFIKNVTSILIKQKILEFKIEYSKKIKYLSR